MATPSRESELDELDEFHRRDYAFVEDDGQRALFLEFAEAGEAIGGDGLLPNVGSDVGEFGREMEGGGGDIVVAVGIEPEESVGNGPLHVAAEVEIELGVGCDLDVEVMIAALEPFVDGLLGLFHVAGVDGPTDRDGERGVRPELGDGALAELAHEVMDGEVDAGFGDGHAGGEGRRDGFLHRRVNAGEVEGIFADEGGRQVAIDSGGDGLGSLVAPGGDGDRLAPAETGPYPGR